MIINVTKDNIVEQIKNNEILLLDFYADWCGPCNRLKEVLNNLDLTLDNITIGKINVDNEIELASEFNVSTIPQLFVIKNGKITNKSIGYISIDEVIKLINE